jgi:hypothetical protein
MSNIAGKAYAMSLVTPIDGPLLTLANKAIFWAVGTPLFRGKLKGLLTLSMIHYARWVIVKGSELPRLSPSQPEEDLRYSYMFFFSNFNGSWAQYIDSFSAAIPGGLNLLWWRNVGWPKAVPEQPFHRYVSHNQLFTDHYYSAYPMAASNDVKAAQRVTDGVRKLAEDAENATPEQFAKQYDALLRELQHDLGQLAPTPIVSLAAAAAAERQRKDTRRPSQSERVKVA